MFCECKCIPLDIIEEVDILEEDSDVTITDITQLTGTINVVVNVNKDYYSDFQMEDMTIEEGNFEDKPYSESYKRNLTRLKNDFRSYFVDFTRNNREVYYREIDSKPFEDIHYKTSSVEILNEKDNISYPLEDDFIGKHRRGGLIQIVDIFDEITHSSPQIKMGIYGAKSNHGVASRDLNNSILEFAKESITYAPYSDDKVKENIFPETTLASREIYDESLRVINTVNFYKNGQEVSYFNPEVSFTKPWNDVIIESDIRNTSNLKGVSYSNTTYDKDFSKSQSYESISFYGLLD